MGSRGLPLAVGGDGSPFGEKNLFHYYFIIKLTMSNHSSSSGSEFDTESDKSHYSNPELNMNIGSTEETESRYEGNIHNPADYEVSDDSDIDEEYTPFHTQPELNIKGPSINSKEPSNKRQDSGRIVLNKAELEKKIHPDHREAIDLISMMITKGGLNIPSADASRGANTISQSRGFLKRFLKENTKYTFEQFSQKIEAIGFIKHSIQTKWSHDKYTVNFLRQYAAVYTDIPNHRSIKPVNNMDDADEDSDDIPIHTLKKRKIQSTNQPAKTSVIQTPKASDDTKSLIHSVGALRHHNANLKTRVNDLTKDTNNKDKIINDLQREITHYKEKLENSHQANNNIINEQTKEIDNLIFELNSSKKSINTLVANSHKYEQSYQTLIASYNNKKKQILDLEGYIESSRLETDNLRNEIFNTKNENEMLRHDICNTKNENDSLKRMIEYNTLEINNMIMQNNTLKCDIRAIIEQHEQKVRQLQNLIVDINNKLAYKR